MPSLGACVMPLCRKSAAFRFGQANDGAHGIFLRGVGAYYRRLVSFVFVWPLDFLIRWTNIQWPSRDF